MYKKLKINYELSKKVYEKYKDIIKIKSCYHNVAMIIASSSIEVLNLKICFGAWQIPISDDNDSNLFAKHCFFVKDDDIVDPTYFATNKDDIDYMIFKTFTVDEYLEYLIKDNFDASLPSVTNYMFNEIAIELMKENTILIG